MNGQDEEFDDGFDYIVYDKKTGSQLARFTDQKKVLPFAWKKGRQTVGIKKVKRGEKYVMSKSKNTGKTIVNLSEMKIEKVKEDLLLPKTNNPEKEAETLTDETGVYHYAIDDKMTGKPAIVRTNVKALNEEEWIRKSFYSPDKNVIEPNNFEKNDQYDVSSVDQVAEADEQDEKFPNGKWDEVVVSVILQKWGITAEIDLMPYGIDKMFEMEIDFSVDPGRSQSYGQPEERPTIDINSQSAKANPADCQQYINMLPDDVWEEIGEQVTSKFESGDISEASINEGYDRDAWAAGYEAFENGHPCPEDPSGKDGWMEAKKEHRKAGQMDEAEESSDWTPGEEGVCHHNILPLAYDMSSGKPVLYELPEDDEGGVICIGSFDSVEEMNEWINANLKDGVAEQYQQMAEDAIRTAEQGVDNSDGSEYGPAPVKDQNEMEFDKDGKFEIDEDSMSDIEDTAKDYASTNIDDHVDEGKSWKHDPDADEEDWVRQDRFKQRQHDKKDRRKEVSESDGEIDEGKDYRYDPDADDEDWDRQERFKQRQHDKRNNRKEVEEGEDMISEADVNSRLYVLSMKLKPDSIEMIYKGMADFDSAVDIASGEDPSKVEEIKNGLQVGGVPAVEVVKGDDEYTLTVLDTNLRDAIESAINTDLVVDYLNELEISEDVFYGFMIQAKVGDVMNDSTELAEDEIVESPEFVVSSDDVTAEGLAQDPAFVEAMQEAYLTIAEKYGERVETFDPDMAQIDEVIAQGIDNYPNGKRFSFMITDSVARDAIFAAFGLLWDEGKVGPENLD